VPDSEAVGARHGAHGGDGGDGAALGEIRHLLRARLPIALTDRHLFQAGLAVPRAGGRRAGRLHALRALRFLVLVIRPLLGRGPLSGHQLGVGWHGTGRLGLAAAGWAAVALRLGGSVHRRADLVCRRRRTGGRGRR
jgi:hypothetical protein